MKIFNAKDAKYVRDYKRWFDKLPKKQKAFMKNLGIDKPHIDEYSTHQQYDVSDLQIADTSLPYDETLDEKIYSRAEMHSLYAQFVEKIMHEFLSKRNSNLTAECMLLILGQSPHKSEQEIANALKMSRANVSARCIELKDKFGLENSGYGRNLSIRKTYSKTQKAKSGIDSTLN